MTIKEKKTKIIQYRNDFRQATIDNMKMLGVYKPQFNKTIEMYADMLAQYEIAWQEFVESGCKAECPTKAGGVRKTAALTTMEELRRQIGAYSDRLRLTPKTAAEKETKEESKFERAMEKIEKLRGSV